MSWLHPKNSRRYHPISPDNVTRVTTIDRDQLLESAEDFADRALRAYVEGDRRVILQNAAISMGHLSKAYLADLNPALLVELQRDKFDSLLHLVGLGDKARKAKYPRTISAREALARVEQLLPGLTAPKDELGDLINVRDGVIHVGYLAEANARKT